jgi:hypothetical protein
MGGERSAIASLLVTVLLLGISTPCAFGAGASSSDEAAALNQIKREINQLQADRQSDLKHIQQLEHQVDEIQSRNQELEKINDQLSKQQAAQRDSQLKSAQQIQSIQAQVAKAPSVVSSTFENWFGSHRFTVLGDADMSYFWNGRHTNTTDDYNNPNNNSFIFDTEAIILYNVNDKFNFVFTPGYSEDASNGGSFDCAPCYGDFLMTPTSNLNLDLELGRFDMPFNDYFEDYAVGWIKQTVDDPIAYAGVNSIVPGTADGVMLRATYDMSQWHAGFMDSVAYVVNGPRFADTSPQPSSLPGILPKPPTGPFVPGASLIENQVDLNRAKGYGGRIRFYPLGDASEYGLLRIGASTFDGNWDGNGHYYLSWGLAANYVYDVFRIRAEYMNGDRQVPGTTSDRRDGWYMLAGYSLAHVLPAPFNRLELFGMYSGADHRYCNVDPSTFGGPYQACVAGSASPITQPREYATGFDYWITPSLVYKLEGAIQSSGDNHVDPQVLTSVAVGF